MGDTVKVSGPTGTFMIKGEKKKFVNGKEVKEGEYRKEVLEDCPDCGGILTGNICHECESIWEFVNVATGEGGSE